MLPPSRQRAHDGRPPSQAENRWSGSPGRGGRWTGVADAGTLMRGISPGRSNSTGTGREFARRAAEWGAEPALIARFLDATATWPRRRPVRRR